MLRRDSSSLIPRDSVRFLGEVLSTVTESIFNVLMFDFSLVEPPSNPLAAEAVATPRLELRKATGSKLVHPTHTRLREKSKKMDDDYYLNLKTQEGLI